MSSFTKKLLLSPLKDKYWEIMEPFQYEVGEIGSGEVINIEQGFITDFASVPHLKHLYIPMGIIVALIIARIYGIDWLLWTSISIDGVLLYLSLMPPWKAEYGKAAIIHDWLYQNNDDGKINIWRRMVSKCRARADRVFLEGMTVLNNPWWKKYPMYYGVRIAGWMAYKPKKERIDSK
jgi:hypothetical protein